MTTIATDGRSMASDSQVQDHRDVVVDRDRPKVHRLDDGRIVGAAGNSFDADAWVAWVSTGKNGDCPIQGDSFVALILNLDGSVLWVDHKGREVLTPVPCAIGSGEEIALGAMDAGVSPYRAVEIACNRDIYSGGPVRSLFLIQEPLHAAA